MSIVEEVLLAFYWSSTNAVPALSEQAWAVDFAYGTGNLQAKTTSYQGRPVRGGQLRWFPCRDDGMSGPAGDDARVPAPRQHISLALAIGSERRPAVGEPRCPGRPVRTPAASSGSERRGHSGGEPQAGNIGCRFPATGFLSGECPLPGPADAQVRGVTPGPTLRPLVFWRRRRPPCLQNLRVWQCVCARVHSRDTLSPKGR